VWPPSSIAFFHKSTEGRKASLGRDKTCAWAVSIFLASEKPENGEAPDGPVRTMKRFKKNFSGTALAKRWYVGESENLRKSSAAAFFRQMGHRENAVIGAMVRRVLLNRDALSSDNEFGDWGMGRNLRQQVSTRNFSVRLRGAASLAAKTYPFHFLSVLVRL